MGGTPELPRTDFIKWMKGIESKLSFIMERLNNVFANTGLSVPGPGVVEVDGTLNVLGSENVSGTLNVTGNTVIGGTLSLPNGIINNAALTSPLNPVTLHADASNFGPTTGAGITIMTVSTTVPAGYTQALLIGMYMSAFAHNSTASTDSLYVNIATTPSLAGWQVPSPTCPAGAWTSAYQQGTLLIPGLTGGGTLSISGQVSTGSANWAASTSNVANLDVSIIFLR
jgi:hypothetical protein